MTRGDVYWAVLRPRSGSERMGRRPVVVVSHDIFNREAGWRSVIVVPISTSRRQAARGPTAVAIEPGVAGLREESVAVCHQVTTLDRAKLDARTGTLSPDVLGRIEIGLKMALGMV